MSWDLNALHKSATEKKIAGVCGGLGEHSPLPAWIWRAIFLLTAVCGGFGLLV